MMQLKGTTRWTLPRRFLLLALSGPIASVACRDMPPTSTAPAHKSGADNLQTAIASVDLHPYERQAREISSRIPSFAGYAMDRATGNAVAYVVNSRDGDAAVVEVGQLTADQRASALARGFSGGVVVRPARFTYMQLSNWRDSLLFWRELSNVGVLWVDLAEEKNVIEIGIDPSRVSTATPRIRARLTAVGGDNAALHFVAEAGRVELARKAVLLESIAMFFRANNDSLTSKVRPLRGGITVTTSAVGCTLGFIVKFDNVYYATTASHCSAPTKIVTGIPMVQGGRVVAVEAFDPAPYVIVPPDSARWSETALYRIYTDSSDATFDFGRLARAENNLGSLKIDPSSPYFQLTAEENGGIADDWYVYHEGVGTGWRYGWVVRSCFDDIQVAASIGYRLHCQFRADFYTDLGDSGGPVFAPYQGGFMTIGTIYGKYDTGWPYYIHNQGLFSGFRGLDLDLTGSFNSGRLRST